MGRPCILLDRPMTNAERQRRHRAKLAEIIVAENVLEALQRDYARAHIDEKKTIRVGVKRLLARWHRDAEGLRRYWEQLRHKSRKAARP
jgi:hypothetical protein